MLFNKPLLLKHVGSEQMIIIMSEIDKEVKIIILSYRRSSYWIKKKQKTKKKTHHSAGFLI